MHLPKKCTSTNSKTLKRCCQSHGFWANCMLWWPVGSLGVGTTIHMSSLSSIVDLLDLLLLYTKSWANLLAIVNLVLVEWFLVWNQELKLCTLIHLLLNPMLGSWTWKIVDDNFHLAVDGQSQWCSLIPIAQPCDNVYNNHKWCHCNDACHC